MAARVLNVNVGVLGHIDSGKTALATTGSTAAFDRAPQSRARGITLDLGFSCLRTALPPQLGPGPGELQFTLVDCPGHASLIRTIIGGKGGAGGPASYVPLRFICQCLFNDDSVVVLYDNVSWLD
uniref:Tr-type G domain-containing protein n=1 Tax=Ficedula albicollis TaxID=59894 RepID=A0A803VKA5_FICAL